MHCADEIREFNKVDNVRNNYWFNTIEKLNVSKGNTMLSKNEEA